jgi:outer membrane protein assembly factor BamB
MTSGANLYAFDAFNGAKIWNYSTGNVWGVSPVSIRNDMLYASYGAGPPQLHALNVKNGAKLWSVPLGNRISPPKIVDNVVCLSSDTSLLALNAYTGRILWNYTTGVGLGEPVVANGIAYLSAGDQIYAIGLPSELRPINELFPVVLVAVVIVAVAVSAGLLFYFKKRSFKQQSVGRKHRYYTLTHTQET